MRKIICFLTLSLLMASILAQQPRNELIGKVISSLNNQPLKGAALLLKKSRINTMTDNQGRFKILLTANDTLIVTFVGYQPVVVPVSLGQKPLEILLLDENPSELENVTVNTGYQSIAKERATGSFEQINNQSFNQKVSTDVISRLEGTSSILFDKVSSRPPLTIRGLGSINGSTAPLVVVDNFPYDGDINNINPNEVENITILKDAAASSIWGTRAGNGVIVITTKKGKYGEPIRLNINSNLTSTGKPDPYYLKQMSPGDMIDVQEFLFGKGFYTAYEKSTSRPFLSPVVELLIRARDGLTSTQDATAQIDAMRSHDLRDDFKKYVYRNAFNQQYSLDMEGGSAKMRFYLIGGFDKNVDNLRAQYSRANIRSENTFKPFGNLQVSVGLHYMESTNITGQTAFSATNSTLGMLPYTALVDANGYETPVYRYRQPFIDTAGGGNLLNWDYYPLEDYKHNYTTTNIQDVIANAGLQYHIVGGLSFDVRYQYERQGTNANTMQDTSSFYTRDFINRYSQVNRTTNKTTYIVPLGAILDRSQTVLTSNGARGQFNFDKSWDRQALTVIAGGEIRASGTAGNTYRIYGYNPDVLTISSVDYVTQYPNYITGSKSAITSNQSETQKLNRFVSTYANAAYTYDRKYTVSASGRRDASNLFGVNTNGKWTPLWSLGGSWDISKEKFYHFEKLPLLKMRVTYGVSGNVDQTRSAVTTIKYSTAAASYTNLLQSNISQFSNPDLRWEKDAMLDVGLDFATSGSRLHGSVDLYQKNGKDLFGAVPIDYTTGAGLTGTITKNVAGMKGQGIDVNLNWNAVKTKFRWDIGLIASYNHSIITNYAPTSQNGYDYVNSGLTKVAPLAGKPVYSILTLKWAGLDSAGNPMGYVNGQRSTSYTTISGSSTKISDLVYSGPATPTVYGSLTNSFGFAGFTLTACVSYKLGYYFKRNSINYSQLFSVTPQTNSDYSLRWQQPGDELKTSVPSMVYPANTSRDAFYNSSSVLVERADHIRLLFVNLAYSLDKRNTKWLPLENVQLYANASNLGIIWKANKKGIDPDYANNGIPPPSAIAFGIRAGF